MGSRLHHPLVFVSFLVLALAASWPMPLHLGTHLPGSPAGDTGVYLWNIWVFHHELCEGHLPFFTRKAFPLTGGVDLTLHNYGLFINALAFPLVDRVGLVAAFNLVHLGLVALNGYAVYLLAHYVTTRRLESWLAAAFFALSPVIIARGTAHLSLVAAAPLPLFILALVKALDTGQRRYGVLAGLMVAWAAIADAYYPVYCVVLAAAILGGRLLSVHVGSRHRPARPVKWVHAFDLLLLTLAGLVLGIAVSGGWRFEFLGQRIALVRLYTPVLILTIGLLVRIVIALRPQIRLRDASAWREVTTVGALVVVAAAVPLGPMLVAAGERLADGSFVSPKTYWRSSPPGVDLVNFVLPSPHHPWLGGSTREWLVRDRTDGLAEFTASIPLVVLCVVAFAFWRGAIPRRGIAITAMAALFALGPFIHVAGVNTYVPGPWALARYLPVVGMARSPSRFAILVTLCMAVLFAVALVHLRESSRRRRAATALVVGVLAFELLPVPRTLHSATVPAIYARIRQDPDAHVRVLELPVGIRDGTKSVGDFSARSQFHQTYHEKAVVGGYLSRVSQERIDRSKRFPVIKALIRLSDGRGIDDDDRAEAFASRDRFLEATRVGWVVVDRSRASEPLETFAVQLLDLVKIDEEGPMVLYRPTRHAFSPQPPPPPRGR